jgi:hypothetical protein
MFPKSSIVSTSESFSEIAFRVANSESFSKSNRLSRLPFQSSTMGKTGPKAIKPDGAPMTNTERKRRQAAKKADEEAQKRAKTDDYNARKRERRAAKK